MNIDTGSYEPLVSLPADDYTRYVLYGAKTLTADYDIVAGGALYTGLRVFIYNTSTITLGGNNFTIFGKTVPIEFSDKAFRAECLYNGTSWYVFFSIDISEDEIIGLGKLVDDSVTTAKIADANVTLAKIEELLSGNLIVGNASNRPTSVTPSGDATISNTGVITIGALKVLNAMINDMDAAKLTGTLAAARIAAGSLASTVLSGVSLLDSKYSDTGTTVVTTEETLYSYTLPAGTIASDGGGIKMVVGGTFAATANAKTLKLKFGGITYSTNAVTASPNGLDFRGVFEVLRTGAAGAVGFSDLDCGAVSQGVQKSKAGITWANANDVVVTGQNGVAALNDIVLSMVTVEQIR